MTQQDLADRLNVTVGTVRRWETVGDTGIDPSKLSDIAQATGVSVDFLMGGVF